MPRDPVVKEKTMAMVELVCTWRGTGSVAVTEIQSRTDGRACGSPVVRSRCVARLMWRIAATSAEERIQRVGIRGRAPAPPTRGYIPAAANDRGFRFSRIADPAGRWPAGRRGRSCPGLECGAQPPGIQTRT